MTNSVNRQKGNIRSDMDLDFNANIMSTEEKNEYLNETRLEPQFTQIEETYETGTIKITEELAKKAVQAVVSRIEATKDYTEQRVKRVNDNYKMYEQKDLSTEAQNQMYYGVVSQSIKDWVDDLYLMFSKLKESIDIEVEDVDFEKYIVKKLGYKANSEQDNMLSAMLSEIPQINLPKEKRAYAFDRLSCIKSFLVSIIDKSGYMDELREYLTHGIISGLFCSKETYGIKKANNIILREESEGSVDGKEYIGLGSIISEVKEEDCFQFKAVDTRNLIFPKNKNRWNIEKIETTFHELLEECVDIEGKPLANSPYDIKQLQKIKEYIKQNNPTDIFSGDDESLDDLHSIDGNIIIYESHNIPLVIGKKVTKCVITTVCVKDTHIPIRIQPTWFYNGHPYRFVCFDPKDKDFAGNGLPDLLCNLQEKINDIFNFTNDILEFAIYGITVGDKDAFIDANGLGKISPRKFFQLKNMDGRKISDVFDWLRPPIDLMNPALDMMNVISEMVSKTSRKGVSGEKIAPNPSATEFDSIARELQKSVNLVAIELSKAMQDMLKTAYAYTLLNRSSYTRLKMKGVLVSDMKMKEVAQVVEFTPRELYLKDIDFNVNVMDYDPNKVAVERQQDMQAIDLIYKVGVTEQSVDPMTGQPTTGLKTYYDEVGNELVIDEYKLLSGIMKRIGFDATDIFKRKQEEEKQSGLNSLSNGGGGVDTVNSPSVPNLQASPKTGDIMKGVMNI